MKNNTFPLATFVAAIFLLLPAFGFAMTGDLESRHGATLSGGAPYASREKECPPVANIKVEIMQNGKAIFSWDSIAGVPKYFVKLTDEYQNIIIDTIVSASHLMAGGLIRGRQYTLSVCYWCEENERLICGYKNFRYIIIEDQVVMYEGGNPCQCSTPVGTEGICNSSLSPHYTLESSRIYNILLMDNSGISIICTESINPIGNCQMDFGGVDYAAHGSFNAVLPFYTIGNSKVFFHGTTFCVQGEAVENISYCDISSKKDRQAVHVPAEKIYPNPFSDMLVVETEETKTSGGETMICLYNVMGQMVLEKTTSAPGRYTIETGQIAPGVYTLCINGKDRPLSTRRLLKLE